MVRPFQQHPTETPRRKALIITAAAAAWALGQAAILYTIKRPHHVRAILGGK